MHCFFVADWATVSLFEYLLPHPRTWRAANFTTMNFHTLTSLLQKSDFSDDEIVTLLALTEPQACEMLRQRAFEKTTRDHGSFVYYRGLIEISNVCTVNCRYCGIRRDNHALKRYEMSEDEIVQTALWAAAHGYGSICLQAGERRDEKFISFVEQCLKRIHRESCSRALPDGLGITLSLGDQTEETYRRWAKASGNPRALRYLSRFETSNPDLFAWLHGARGAHEKNIERRFECLASLRRCGYQVGTGVMIGIPGQSLEDLCRDIRTFQRLDVDMLGMGPFLNSQGSDLTGEQKMPPERLLRLTLNMLAVTRLVMGPVNMAAATALDVLNPRGREMGILHGCNVIMPNISPATLRCAYQLYDNKSRLIDGPPMNEEPLEDKIARCGRAVGWNQTGSSLRYRQRTASA